MNIKDIAALAKVSVSTVSKVLNNKDKDISEDTRKKVLKIVKEYQYVPYSKVRESSIPKCNMFGFILPDRYKEVQELVYHIEKQARINGYSLVLSYTDGTKESEEKAIKILESKNVEGIILLSLDNNIEYSKIQTEINQIPLVLLQKREKNNTIAVVFSEEEAGYIATQYLIEVGHRNIGCFLCSDEYGEDFSVKKGYMRALYSNGILYQEDKVITASTAKEAGQIGIQKLMNTNITAILCEDNDIACCVYNLLQSRGVQIPSEISIISTKDSTIGELLCPPLTSVELPLEQVGMKAIQLMLELTECKKKPKQQQQRVQPVIHERKSVYAPRKGKYGQVKKIIVVGSMNMDITIEVPTIPTDGETILSSGTVLIPGGKGANQAVGAGKLGGCVYAIGRLGSDNDGKEIYNSLVRNSVKTDGVIFDTISGTGKAYINVSKNGESTIVVYPGANHKLDRKQLKQFKSLFREAKFCLLSLEIPNDTAEHTILLCEKYGVEVILKPSAVDKVNLNLLNKITYMIPNEKELNLLIPGKGTIEEKANYFYEQGVKNVIVTLGNKGCYLKNEKYSTYFPSADFIALDTTGAADAFISALAVSLSEDNDIITAICFAIYCAGISITRQGVQPALPDRMTVDIYKDEIDELINGIRLL